MRRGLRLLDVMPRADARVGAAGGDQLREGVAVDAEPGRLHDGLAVPVEPEPAQVLEHPGGGAGLLLRVVEVLDPEQDAPAARARREPREQKRARVAQMQRARGARREASDDGVVRLHARDSSTPPRR